MVDRSPNTEEKNIGSAASGITFLINIFKSYQRVIPSSFTSSASTSTVKPCSGFFFISRREICSDIRINKGVWT